MTDIKKVKQKDNQYYMNTFGNRIDLVFTHGVGCKLYDQDGQEYTDFLAGIATNALGYAHEGFTQAVADQASKILHCSNYFYIEQQADLAALLCENSCADKAFFASTGAEANEGAIKLARKYFASKNEDKYEIISANNSFHGRTLATLAATGQEKYRAPFAPLPPGFINVAYGDIQPIKDAITPHTAAILLEPIQGEGGIIEGSREYFSAVRALCDALGILLIFDEVQTGMGRTGTLFAHQLLGVEPDIFTLAKALGNGIPISAVLCKDFCSAFEPSDHGTTFGGNPFCCTAGLYVTKFILHPGFLDSVKQKGAFFKQELIKIKDKTSAVSDVRGKGLMIGVELSAPLIASEIAKKLRNHHFIVGTASRNTIRLVPPLIISQAEILSFCQALEKVLVEN